MNVYRKERIVLILLLGNVLLLLTTPDTSNIDLVEYYTFFRKAEKLLGGIKQ
jgi:hypothetical protein